MSGPDLAKLAELGLIVAAVAGFGFWQLRSLRKLREQRKDDEG